MTLLDEGLPSTEEEDCKMWEYDTSQYKSSIVTDVRTTDAGAFSVLPEYI